MFDLIRRAHIKLRLLCACCVLFCAHPQVRAYAVSRLEKLTDAQLQTYLLQLTQVLKFEPFVDSALARFLLRRAARSPTTVGHVFFWFLKAEMHVTVVRRRYGMLLEQYLRVCPSSHREALGHQLFFMTKLESIAQAVRCCFVPVVFPASFPATLSPRVCVCVMCLCTRSAGERCADQGGATDNVACPAATNRVPGPVPTAAEPRHGRHWYPRAGMSCDVVEETAAVAVCQACCRGG